MDKQFINKLFDRHKNSCQVPSRKKVYDFFEALMSTMFPEMTDDHFANPHELALKFEHVELSFKTLLSQCPLEGSIDIEAITNCFFEDIPGIYESLELDAKAMYEGDPAARSVEEVIRTYPGFYAVSAHRIAHQLWNQSIRIIPRAISELAHSHTGIDIHPGATIGASFCIDHGTGIVIGETAHIGNRVKIYQGVTLGALSVHKRQMNKKRHPTIKDNVVIYAGATILGGETTVGESSIIGGNVWLVNSVPPHSKIYYKNL